MHGSEILLKQLHVALEEEAAARVRARIDAAFGQGTAKPTNGHITVKRRKLSAAGRKAIQAAVMARWAKYRKEKGK